MVAIISSSSLLISCAVPEYVGKGRLLFISRELDETQSNTKSRIKDLKDNCFGAVATAMIEKLVDYFGPEARQVNQPITPATTRAIVNLNPEYDNNVVELQQILSMMDHVLWKKYNENTDREVKR